jgi:tetratricopeptide (TPR) repeat protein
MRLKASQDCSLIYGIIFSMPKKKIDETLPMNEENRSEELKPSLEISVTENTVPVNAAKKPRKVFKSSDESVKAESQQPSISETSTVDELEVTPKKVKRSGYIWLGILGMFVIAVLGAGLGYLLAIEARKNAQNTQTQIAATTQYELSLQDIKENNLSMAKKRLEYVIQIYPSYPGAADKLAEVMVQMAQSGNSTVLTPAAIATVEPTKDTRGAAAILTTAQQQFSSADWQNLYNSINSLRDLDPSYEPVKTDGLYYLALRNMGIINISSGNMEKGLYDFSVAEKIGPLDKDAESYRVWARMFLNSAAGYGVVWSRAVDGFSTLYNMVPNMIDFNGITVREYYARSLAGYGDFLQSTFDWCGAVTKYEASLSIMNLQSVVDILPDAREKCAIRRQRRHRLLVLKHLHQPLDKIKNARACVVHPNCWTLPTERVHYNDQAFLLN